MDIALVWNNLTGNGDWSIVNGDVVNTTGNSEGDIPNAIGLSLFTDCRATPGFVPWDGLYRGYWGDSYTDTPLGSNLWQLDRAKKIGTTQLLLQVRDNTTTALQWLIDDGIVSTLTVYTSWIDKTAIGISIQVLQPTQSATQAYNYSLSW